MDDPKETHQQQQKQDEPQNQPPDETLTGSTSTPAQQHPKETQQKQDEQLQPPHGTLTGSTSTLAQQHPQPQQQEVDQEPLGLVTYQRGRVRGRPRKYPKLSEPPVKRARGRPIGSGKKQQQLNALGGIGSPITPHITNALGNSITPHIINVKPKEDIAKKLVEFMNQEPGEFMVLSASGVVSTAMLQSNNPSGVVTYEGQYTITNMSVSFLNTVSDDGTVTTTGKINVSLAGPDHNIVGGFVAGSLVAESHAQVIVGRFVLEKVEQSAGRAENDPKPASEPANDGPGSPRSHQGQQRSSESSEEKDSKVVDPPTTALSL